MTALPAVPVWFGVFVWIAVLSLLSLVQLGLDKSAARRGGWRISERLLLLTALAGGWPGAKLGQRLFRHKTRKQPFKWMLDGAALLNALTVAVLLVPALHPGAAIG